MKWSQVSIICCIILVASGKPENFLAATLWGFYALVCLFIERKDKP